MSIVGSVEYWERQIREFEERGGKPFEDQERITGIIGIIPKASKIKEHLDIVEDKLLTHDDWRREILRYARSRRIESNNHHGGSGGVHQVTSTAPNNEAMGGPWNGMTANSSTTWMPPSWNQTMTPPGQSMGEESIDALGKSKGKGMQFPGKGKGR